MIYEFSNFGTTEYYHMQSGNDLSFYAHMHQSFELMVIFDGEMNVLVENTYYTLHKGEAILIFPNQKHSFSSTKEKHTYWIFSQELVKAFSSQVSGLVPKSNKFAPSAEILNILCKTYDADNIFKKKGALYSLCAEFDESAEYIKKDSTENAFINKMLSFLERNYSTNCSLSAASKQLGYSYSYISRHFKRSVGIPFNSFVNQFRISRACYLLKNTNISILECSMEVGYSSVYSFIRNFKEICKTTPSEYRASKPIIPLF